MLDHIFLHDFIVYFIIVSSVCCMFLALSSTRKSMFNVKYCLSSHVPLYFYSYCVHSVFFHLIHVRQTEAKLLRQPHRKHISLSKLKGERESCSLSDCISLRGLLILFLFLNMFICSDLKQCKIIIHLCSS